jgi:hypothetical protein
MTDIEKAANAAMAILQELHSPRDAVAALALIHAAIIGSHMPCRSQHIDNMITDYIAGLRVAIDLQAEQQTH